MVLTTNFVYLLPFLAQIQSTLAEPAEYIEGRSLFSGTVDLLSRDLDDFDYVLDLVARDLLSARDGTTSPKPAPAPKTAKPPSALNIGKAKAAAPVVDKAQEDAKKTKIPGAIPKIQKTLDKVETAQLSTPYKLSHPSIYAYGSERLALKAQNEMRFGSPERQRAQQKTDNEIGKEQARTKNAQALAESNRKIVGEDMDLAGKAMGLAGQGLGLAKSVVRPPGLRRREDGEGIWERDDEELFWGRSEDDGMEDGLYARGLELWLEEIFSS